MPYARSFRDLVVYQKQRELARELFRASVLFPSDERFSLTDQLRRASRSIGGQIAESWARRQYEKHFVAKLTDADAEQMETQRWIETARDHGYIADDHCLRLMGLCEEIGRMLRGMIVRAGSFCGSPELRDQEGPYSTSDTASPIPDSPPSPITDH